MSGVSLEGEVVVVTGGGQGLGAATCRTLARAGAHVAVADIRAERAEAVAREIAAKLMKQQRRGHIVNVASTAAKRAWRNASAYHATKWGLLGLSYALHAELRPEQPPGTATAEVMVLPAGETSWP